MQLRQLVHHVLHHLHMPALRHLLFPHHLDQVVIPIADLLPCRVIPPELAHHVPVHQLNIHLHRPQHILHLPHIQDIFGHITLSLLACYQHTNL